MGMPKGWRVDFGWLVGLLLLSFVAGRLFGIGSMIMACVLFPLFGWHLYHLLHLALRLNSGKEVTPPYPPGIWGTVYSQIRSLQVGRRKRKRQLLSFLHRFQDAVTALPEAVVILGKGEVIVWCNSASGQLLGISQPSMVGWRLTRAVRHPILEEYLDARDFSRPIDLPSPVKKTIILSLYLTPFGRKDQYLLIARDITRIYVMNQARRDFVANVSHELRTPLTVISGFAETLAEDSVQCPHQARSLELMQQHAGRMDNLINDLLTLSRLEMEQETEVSKSANVADLFGPIINEARMLSGDAGHVLSLEAEQGWLLKGDAKEFRSAFSNLVFNAVRHTPQRCEIRVSWWVDGEGAWFSVRDTGEGIANRHIPRLTERFYRVDRGRSRGSGGTGLGLAIVKHVLQRYGGELRIESEVGRGSTFTCHFPLSCVSSAERS
ncbi:MAG: phosphate regulon sensor histidine kinase PhoR [Gammaproteobacteria bacterium]|nr:phosphate regulon sensor histidine kinase PhoR [Gammaproteobacteria bacterium]